MKRIQKTWTGWRLAAGGWRLAAGGWRLAVVTLVVALPLQASEEFRAEKKFSMTSIGSNKDGFRFTEAIDINNQGLIVGISQFPSGAKRPFLWENGTIIGLGNLNGFTCQPMDINDQDQIIGSCLLDSDNNENKRYHPLQQSFVNRSILWHKGVMTDLGALSGGYTVASKINERGQIVGYSQFISDSNNEPHAFLWENGAMTDLGTLDRASIAVDINERGQVIGNSIVDSNQNHAVLWENGIMTDLGTLDNKPGSGSSAMDINKFGQVVGCSMLEKSNGDDSLIILHAFLWENGVMTDLGTLGGNESCAVAINDHGQIIGNSQTTAGEYRAFLWENGAMIDLGTLDSKRIIATAINNSGQIVGHKELREGSDKNYAFFWENGEIIDLGVLRNDSNKIVINENTQVIGTKYIPSKSLKRAVLWERK